MKTTSVFKHNILAYNAQYRTIVNRGSTRSSKTWSVLQLLYIIAIKAKNPLAISIVSESMPHLKRGCMRDFEAILKEEKLWEDKAFNRTDKIYKVGQCFIEFFSADNAAKVHGPARDILFLNEAINIPYETYRQLAVRTRKTIFLDYNPCYSSWVDERVLKKEDAKLIHSTYKNNEYLTKEQVCELESNVHDAEWWKVYGLGEVGGREGLIYDDPEQCDKMPQQYKNRWVGIDFGFTNDPTAILEVRESDGKLWIDEIAYARMLDNLDIADIIIDANLQNVNIIADSAEPKSIAELQRRNLKVEGAEKGRDSIIQGINTLKRYKIVATKKSVNVIKEFRNYRWQTDRNGTNLNIPADKHNHAMDALRYVALNKISHHKPLYRGAVAKVLKF